jgi:hypothetical protein
VACRGRQQLFNWLAALRDPEQQREYCAQQRRRHIIAWQGMLAWLCLRQLTVQERQLSVSCVCDYQVPEPSTII